VEVGSGRVRKIFVSVVLALHPGLVPREELFLHVLSVKSLSPLKSLFSSSLIRPVPAKQARMFVPGKHLSPVNYEGPQTNGGGGHLTLSRKICKY
jgi:hypothetical protein